MSDRKRWFADIRYQDGTTRSTHLEELEDLHEFVESGEDFYTIDEIIVKPNFQYEGGDPENGDLIPREHNAPMGTVVH